MHELEVPALWPIVRRLESCSVRAGSSPSRSSNGAGWRVGFRCVRIEMAQWSFPDCHLSGHHNRWTMREYPTSRTRCEFRVVAGTAPQKAARQFPRRFGGAPSKPPSRRVRERLLRPVLAAAGALHTRRSQRSLKGSTIALAVTASAGDQPLRLAGSWRSAGVRRSHAEDLDSRFPYRRVARSQKRRFLHRSRRNTPHPGGDARDRSCANWPHAQVDVFPSRAGALHLTLASEKPSDSPEGEWCRWRGTSVPRCRCSSESRDGQETWMANRFVALGGDGKRIVAWAFEATARRPA